MSYQPMTNAPNRKIRIKHDMSCHVIICHKMLYQRIYHAPIKKVGMIKHMRHVYDVYQPIEHSITFIKHSIIITYLKMCPSHGVQVKTKVDDGLGEEVVHLGGGVE